MSKTPLAALALSVAATLAAAQDTQAPAKAAPRPARVAVINFARISGESLMGKGYTARIEALENEIKTEGTKKQAELQKMDAEIKALQDELEKQASVLSPEAADRKRQDIVKKSRDRQAYLEDGQAELQRMRDRAQAQAESLQNEFQQKLQPHISAVAQEKGIDIILNSQVAMAVNPEFDISQDVIAKTDAAERADKAKAGAAAPASPSPSPAAKP